MKITRIKIKYLEGPRLKAVFSITFNNSLTVNDCYIIIDEEKDMKFIAFPFTKNKDGEMLSLAHPTIPTFNDKVKEKVFELYNANEEEFINDGVVDVCRVTGCKSEKIAEGLFEVKLLFNEKFAVNKLVCKVQNNELTFRHPYSREIDGERYNLVNFESQILIQDITMWLAKSCISKKNSD